jgi:hypothetical protein
MHPPPVIGCSVGGIDAESPEASIACSTFSTFGFAARAHIGDRRSANGPQNIDA